MNEYKENHPPNKYKPPKAKGVASKKQQINNTALDIQNEFKILEAISKGSFGEVQKAKHTKTGKIVALKCISKAVLLQFDCISLIKNEIEIHSHLFHPNIINCYGYFKNDNGIVIILEYAENSLINLLKVKGRLPETEVAYYIKQLILVLKYLHNLRIVHRDIKAENILLKNEQIKLCDFGYAKKLNIEKERFSISGTLQYMSIEQCIGEKCDEKVDIWSIGVLTYELLTGSVPFKACTMGDMIKETSDTNLSKLKLPTTSKNAFDFIHAILTNPNKRATLDQLLMMPFIKENQQAQLDNGNK